MSAPTKDFTNYGNINITINNNKNVNKRGMFGKIFVYKNLIFTHS